jgi:hypothetical protein
MLALSLFLAESYQNEKSHWEVPLYESQTGFRSGDRIGKSIGGIITAADLRSDRRCDSRRRFGSRGPAAFVARAGALARGFPQYGIGGL